MRVKIKILAYSLGLFASMVTLAGVAHAEASLTVSPQKYQQIITANTRLNGFIDVSNPSDTTLTVVSDVQGFRQADLAGNLEFFDDPALKAAIVVELTSFELGPRESIRVAFRVDPTLLPKGGVYGAVFFQTTPPTPSSNTSYIAESARVGTLLLLENGTSEHVGSITKFSLPLFQFGDGFTGTAHYRNTDRNPTAAAFAPALSTKVLFWGRATSFDGPYVLPLSEREFKVHQPGSYLGILPLSIRDTGTGQVVTRWAILCTGWYALGLVVLLVFGIITLVRYFIHSFKRSPRVSRRPVDGIRQKVH